MLSSEPEQEKATAPVDPRSSKKGPSNLLARDPSQLVQVLIDMLKSQKQPADKTLILTLRALSMYIHQVRDTLTTAAPNELKQRHIPMAADELEAVVAATAKATHDIIDAAELVRNVAQRVDSDAADALRAASTRILEACTFQDITGQRVTKVMNALCYIEEKMDCLVEAFGVHAETGENSTGQESPSPGASKDDNLLSGPQLPGKAATQEEIDALFDSLG